MSEHPHVQAAREGMEAFNRGDLGAFADLLDDDIVWYAPGKNRFSGEFRGKANTLERFKAQGEGGVTITFDDIHDIVGGDDHVVGLLTLHVTGPGGEHTNPTVFVMHVKGGKVTEFWVMNEDQAEVDRVIDG